jgi:hypothetical protein
MSAAIAIPKDTSVEGLKIFIGQQFVEAGPKFVEETVTTKSPCGEFCGDVHRAGRSFSGGQSKSLESPVAVPLKT